MTTLHTTQFSQVQGIDPLDTKYCNMDDKVDEKMMAMI
jgi:hypothetical protein